MMARSHLCIPAMTDAHIITTDRLVMAPHGIDDFSDLQAMWADPAVVRHFGGVPFNGEDSWARLLRYAGTWALLGFGIWAVRRRDDAGYVGGVGYLEARRDGIEGFDGDPEIGWSLASSAHGQGFATEAVLATLDWGAGRFQRTVAMINIANVPSIAVAERCGFRQFGDGEYKGAAMGLWEYRWL